jgi:hypothetical protein
MTNTTMTDTTFDTSARSDSYLDAILNPDLDPAIIPTVHELDDLMCAMDLHVAFNREAKAELRETGSVAGTRNKLARTYTALNKRLGSSRKLGVQGEVLQQQFRDLLDNQYQPTAETVATLAKITEATSRASLNNTVTTWSGHTAFTLFDATCRDLRTVLTRYRTVRGLPPAPDLLALAKAPHSLILAVSYLMAKAGPAILNAAADKDAATLDLKVWERITNVTTVNQLVQAYETLQHERLQLEELDRLACNEGILIGAIKGVAGVFSSLAEWTREFAPLSNPNAELLALAVNNSLDHLRATGSTRARF